MARPLIPAAVKAGWLPAGTTPARLMEAGITALTESPAARSHRKVPALDAARLHTYVEQSLGASLASLQAETLEKGFIGAAEKLLEETAAKGLGPDSFKAEMAKLADRYGASDFKGSYADTWYRTIISNGARNEATRRTFSTFPTSNLFPFFTYRTVGDSDVRAAHARLDGFVAKVQWPGWSSLTPPIDWNCRCILVPVSYIVANALDWLGQDFPRGTHFLTPVVEYGKLIIPGLGEGGYVGSPIFGP